MKKFWGKFFIFFTYFLVVLGVAYLLKWPKQFDSYVYYENFKLNAYLLLILYRTLIYFLFPFILSLLEMFKSKEKYIKLLLYNFNIQFITYSIITGLYVLLGVDKLLGVEIFGSSDALLFVAGFIFTAIINKNIPSVIENK